MMQSRAFNTINVDYKLGKLIKTSRNIKKLKEEINYYLNIPQNISSYFPTLLEYKNDYSAYTLEYIPYKNVSELMLTDQISITSGMEIIRALMRILNNIHALNMTPTEDYFINEFYIKKTNERISNLSSNDVLNKIINQPSLQINGKHYRNYNDLKREFEQKIEHFSITHLNAIHGDFCFSNILYSPKDNIIKLIDPRGSFGSYVGILGHSYYDYAKLLHCLHGKYDYIVNDQYLFNRLSRNNFTLEIPTSHLLKKLYSFYISSLMDKGMNLEFIFIIEASLFLSMAALHYENPTRQMVIYLTGVKLLNDVLEQKYEDMY